ncbi:MAG TPA: hypothetical protein VIC85_12930 [Ktedonobacterales bacterium]|jgi:hypothetical protein
MQTWEYRVAFVDYRGRISSEGQETLIANERRTAFVRRYMDALGHNGWELVGIQPHGPDSAYYVFKRHGAAADATSGASAAAGSASTGSTSGGGMPGAESGFAGQASAAERV